MTFKIKDQDFHLTVSSWIHSKGRWKFQNVKTSYLKLFAARPLAHAMPIIIKVPFRELYELNSPSKTQIFLKWLPNLHRYCQTRENRENRISPERGDTISDSLIYTFQKWYYMYWYVNWFLKKKEMRKAVFSEITLFKNDFIEKCVISWNTIFNISLFFLEPIYIKMHIMPFLKGTYVLFLKIYQTLIYYSY